MTTETIFILVTGAIAALVGIGALVAALRARSEPAQPDAPGMGPSTPDSLSATSILPPSYQGAVRVAWWVAIAGIMVGIGVADAYPENRVGIYALAGGAAVLVVVLHELLPVRWRGGTSAAIEVLGALALATGLIWLTRSADSPSPFVFVYHLVAVAAALTLGAGPGLGVAAAATLGYLGVLLVDPTGRSPSSDTLLRVGIDLGSLWLLTSLAGVYANAERRVRASALELSQTDPLTGLLNRGRLFPTLEQEVQRTRRSGRGFCVLMVDLDGLKAINDSMGHLRGDEVLRAVSRAITRSIRNVDSAYRYGGDEFIVLLPETEFIGAYVVAEKIREGVEEIAPSIGTEESSTSVSIGLVSHPEDGSSAEELMIAADRAMYQAKSLGKNQITGYPRTRRTGPRQLPEPPAQAPPPALATDNRPEPGAAPSSAAFAVLPARTNGAPAEVHGEDEPDPADVRRHIASARRNMDPDHQIRRAMDALLSTPTAGTSDAE